MKWSNIRLIMQRELRDQLRDRRTLFMISVLPLLLYPLIGMTFFQVTQFLREHPSKVWIIGAEELPATPPLLDDEHFSPAVTGADNTRQLLEVEIAGPEELTNATRAEEAHRAISQGKFDAVIVFPRGFAEQLRHFRQGVRSGAIDPRSVAEGAGVPQPELIYSTAKDASKVAETRVSAVLGRWRNQLVRQTLLENNLSIHTTEPFTWIPLDVADEGVKRAAVWSKILPFVLIIWALTGAFYPAVDLCAGEKERGTLETLLSSPAERSEIVCGKLLTVMFFSMATSILNLVSMGLTGAFLIGQVTRGGGEFARSLDLGMPPWWSLLWLLIALVPISALFSALTLALATMARSTKEGQYYLMPLLLVSMPLMMLPMLPASELNFGTALIPVSGVILLLRSLIEAQYYQAAIHALPVVAVTGVCMFLAVRWAIDQFNNESVLFRESERLDLGLWLVHLVRDRRDTPGVAEAMMCGLMILLIGFFAALVAAPPTSWNSFATSAVVRLIAFIATPALLMTIILTRSPQKTLLIKWPPLLAIPAAVLLAVCLNPLVLVLGQVVNMLYPMSDQMRAELGKIVAFLDQAPNVWILLGVLALAPAVCEEIAFRGFILSGLRHQGHKWLAICVSAALFGIAHQVLQQSLMAFATGIVIGYIAIQTGSLLPPILYHFTHNALAIFVARISEESLTRSPALQLLGKHYPDAHGELMFLFHPWVVALSGGLAIGLLLWFRSLPWQATPEEKLQDALDREPEPAENSSATEQ